MVNPKLLYPPQNPIELGVHYTRHVSAMTSEGLYLKSAIAEQLAYRDKRIEELEAENAELAEEVERLRRGSDY